MYFHNHFWSNSSRNIVTLWDFFRQFFFGIFPKILLGFRMFLQNIVLERFGHSFKDIAPSKGKFWFFSRNFFFRYYCLNYPRYSLRYYASHSRILSGIYKAILLEHFVEVFLEVSKISLKNCQNQFYGFFLLIKLVGINLLKVLAPPLNEKLQVMLCNLLFYNLPKPIKALTVTPNKKHPTKYD